MQTRWMIRHGNCPWMVSRRYQGKIQTAGYDDVSFRVVVDGEGVEVESHCEGTDYLTLFDGEGGREFEYHPLIIGVVKEYLHCHVKSQSFRIIHVGILLSALYSR